MFEVVTAVAWDEWEGIVMVTIVLVGACVCDTDPAKRVERRKSLTTVSVHSTDSSNAGKALGEAASFP